MHKMVTLASSAGKLVLSTLSAVAEMERDLLVERTNAGLARARAEGKTLGRPKITNDKSASEIMGNLGEGQVLLRSRPKACVRRPNRTGSTNEEFSARLFENFDGLTFTATNADSVDR
jgi:DNA invertase Pin-like site-specific DNA recombinase